jgi:threonine dehydrogenase-like Zn-dependent dehydrogenase
MPASFRRVVVIGTGLIGGSFGLAFRKHFPESAVVGWDKPDVLRHALERGAIQEGIPELARAVAGDRAPCDVERACHGRRKHEALRMRGRGGVIS